MTNAEALAMPGWVETVGEFAKATGVEAEKVLSLLISLIGEPSEAALLVLANKEAVPDKDIKDVLKELNIPSGVFNMNVAKLRGKVKEEVKTSVSTPGRLSMLPSLPDEASFLASLQVGGVLKVDVAEVVATVKAVFASRIGLFGVPDKIREKMEAFAQKQEEPCGEEYYHIERMLTEKRYGDVLAVLNLTTKFVSEGKKKEFLEKAKTKLWPALIAFNAQLIGWQKSWMDGVANPGMVMIALAAEKSGAQMPPNIMTPPDTAMIHAAAEAVADDINRIFAGPGIPIARALGYDATRIMGILANEKIPAQMGLTTKEQMLKDLGINVGSDLVRMEQAVVRYVLAIMELKKVPQEDEAVYLSSMVQLSTTIPWDQFSGTKSLGQL